MRKALIALLAGGAMAVVALPALAQQYDDGVAQRADHIGARIDGGLDNGMLTQVQADRLRMELHQIVDLDNRYQDEGMADWQIRDLNSGLSLLGSRLNYDLSVNTDDGDDY